MIDGGSNQKFICMMCKFIFCIFSVENILDHLAKRPIVGDGSYVMTLEKRGYVRAGAFTPEAVIENPDAGKVSYKDLI